jgi:heme exporter protein C
MKLVKQNRLLNFLYAILCSIAGIGILYWSVKLNDSKSVAILSVLSVWSILAYAIIKFNFWRELCVVLIGFTIVEGLLGEVPRLVVLNETIRNLYYHVSMWLGMVILLLSSVVFSIRYLSKDDLKWDIYAEGAGEAGMLLGILGLVTGMIWAKFTWGSYWSNDPKQLYTAIGLLLYLGYFLLRGSFDDEIKRAKIASVYNIFSFPSLIVLMYVLPRMMTSLHPGQEGNPAFSQYDLNDDMRIIFYPAVVAWTLLATWVASVRVRTKLIELKWINR